MDMLCLLCLKLMDNNSLKPRAKLTIRIETVCKLLAPNSLEFKDGDDEMCEFCTDCYPLFTKMEEIRTQIAHLEGEIFSKMEQIKSTILHRQLQKGGGNGGKILQIRDMILRLTIGGNIGDQQLGENWVKIEQDDDDQGKEDELDDEIDPLGDLGDQFFPGEEESNLYCEEAAEIEVKEENDLIGEDEDAFCIIPFSQMKSGSESNNEKSRKRRTSEDSQTVEETETKRINLTPPPRRLSPRVKKSTPKRRVVSSEKSSSEDQDTNPELGEDDSVSKTQNLSIPPKPKRRKLDFTIPCLAPSCTVKFRSKIALFAHLRTVHKDDDLIPSYQCKICGTKCGRRAGLVTHMMTRHEKGEKTLSCGKCGKKFCLEENLARHVALHDLEGSKPYACAVCEERFEDEERLRKHSATHEPKFQCTHCAKRFHNREAFGRHERSHTGERPEKCSLCDSTFARKVTLQRHMLRDHSSTTSTTTPQNICHICGKGFHLPCDLKAHVDRGHEGKLQVKCDTCGEMFIGANTLQAHRIKTHGEDPVVCDECGKTFTSTSTLRSHKKIHTGVKNQKCETCGACFFSPYRLKKHIRVHTGERPYPCAHCEKAFKQRTDMNKHVKAIHKLDNVAP